jgi:rhodanese-related sulfurtransferase
MADLTQTEWSSQLANDADAVIIDVRTEAEIAEGYIPSMKHMDIFNSSGFMEAAKQMVTSKNYYVYCRSGARSAQACAILNTMGFKNTYNLMGGFMEWQGEKTI